MTSKSNRVVIIDPICIGRSGIEEYTEGLFNGLINNKTDVYLFSHYSCGIENKRVYKFFLFFSERLKDGIIRKSIRAFEYFFQSLFSAFLVKFFIITGLPFSEIILMSAISICIKSFSKY